MADTLRMSFSVTAVEEISAGNSQTHSVIDSVAQRAFGGTLNHIYNAGVDSDKIALWSKVVVSQEDAASMPTNGLDAHGWTEASATTRGTIPSQAKMMAIEYASSIGTANNPVYVMVTDEGSTAKFCLARLTPGDGVVIPLFEQKAHNAAFTNTADAVGVGGIAPEKIFITVDDYDNGTNEATINVLLAGR
tara:strand:- start:2280 stop:2852 length:573 start_codon:yes stop_codon:yes gene_type:complete